MKTWLWRLFAGGNKSSRPKRSLLGGRIVGMAHTQSREPIRYSLATIAGDLPPTDESRSAPPGVQSWHEDDWRQVEFVPLQDATYLADVLQEHADFRKRHREEYGFTALYIRNDNPNSIRSLHMPVHEVETLAGPDTTRGRLYLGPSARAFEVIGGHTFEISGLGTVYCTETDALIEALGLFPGDLAARPSRDALERLAVFGRKHGLGLVDWEALFAFDIADADAVNEWLAAKKRGAA